MYSYLLEKEEKNARISHSLLILGEISSSFAHEVKNLLQPLKLLISPKFQPDVEDMPIIHGALKRIDHQVADFLALAKPADFRLDGHLIGNFQSKGKLVIGPAGMVKGDVICKNADIEGIFEGKIQVLEILNVKAKAHIKGEVICGKLSVEPGAEFSATCVMKPQVKNLQNDGQSTEEKAS